MSPSYLVLVRVVSPVALALLVLFAYHRIRLQALLWLLAAQLWGLLVSDLMRALTSLLSAGASGHASLPYWSNGVAVLGEVVWWGLALTFVGELNREIRELGASRRSRLRVFRWLAAYWGLTVVLGLAPSLLPRPVAGLVCFVPAVIFVLVLVREVEKLRAAAQPPAAEPPVLVET